VNRSVAGTAERRAVLGIVRTASRDRDEMVGVEPPASDPASLAGSSSPPDDDLAEAPEVVEAASLPSAEPGERLLPQEARAALERAPRLHEPASRTSIRISALLRV